MAENIVLYTIGCPQCNALERKLEEKGIKYERNTDVEEMMNLGFEHAPVLKVGEEFMGFKKALAWVGGKNA